MRVIVAYLAACAVAATITVFYCLFEIGIFPTGSLPTDVLISLITMAFSLILAGTGFIGGVLAVP